MLPTIHIIVTAILSVAIIIIKRVFNNKKTLLTGPLSSGKTTFLQYISKDIIPNGPSGAPRRYKVNDAIFDEVTDLSGAESWLDNKFDVYIKEHDYIFFFFDVSEYTKDEKYRDDSNARIDMIYRHYIPTQKIVIIGTHIDEMSGNYKAEVEKFFAGKSYQSVLNRIAYVDTTKKECVATIFKELQK